MKGASWAAGTISTAPDVEVCNSQQQAREKKEKRPRSVPLPARWRPPNFERHMRAQRCGGMLMPISVSLDSSVEH